MIPASDLWMLGLRTAPSPRTDRRTPRRKAAHPLRDLGEMFWAQARLDDALKEPSHGTH